VLLVVLEACRDSEHFLSQNYEYLELCKERNSLRMRPVGNSNKKSNGKLRKGMAKMPQIQVFKSSNGLWKSQGAARRA
jgi:hypothetical protein